MAERVAALKALRPHSKVYLNSPNLRDNLFGKVAMKQKDGKTNMTVAVDGRLWRVPYSLIDAEPMNEFDRRGKVALRNIFLDLH